MLHPWRKRTCTFVPHAMHALQRAYRDGNERARAFLTRALARYNTRMAASVADKQAAGRRTAEWFPCLLPHTGSCFAGSPSGRWLYQASTACSAHGSSPAAGEYPDSGIVTSAAVHQAAGGLCDPLRRHAITIKQEAGRARRRELWDA